MKSETKFIDVESGECVVSDLAVDSILSALPLGNDIAVCLWSPELDFAALGRNITPQRMEEILVDISARDTSNARVQVTIVGGDSSDEAKENEHSILGVINEFNNEMGIFDINILANDVIHPNYCILSTSCGFCR